MVHPSGLSLSQQRKKIPVVKQHVPHRKQVYVYNHNTSASGLTAWLIPSKIETRRLHRLWYTSGVCEYCWQEKKSLKNWMTCGHLIKSSYINRWYTFQRDFWEQTDAKAKRGRQELKKKISYMFSKRPTFNWEQMQSNQQACRPTRTNWVLRSNPTTRGSNRTTEHTISTFNQQSWT